MAITLPLDLETWFVNTFSGSETLFIFLAVITIAAMAASFQMPGWILFAMFVVFTGVMMGTSLSGSFIGIYALLIIFIAIVVGYQIANAFK